MLSEVTLIIACIKLKLQILQTFKSKSIANKMIETLIFFIGIKLDLF